MILLLGRFFAEELEVGELIYAKVAFHLCIPEKKVLTYVEAAMKVIV